MHVVVVLGEIEGLGGRVDRRDQLAGDCVRALWRSRAARLLGCSGGAIRLAFVSSGLFGHDIGGGDEREIIREIKRELSVTVNADVNDTAKEQRRGA